MQLVLSDDEKMVVRFDPGEEIFSGLVNFAKERGIDAAFISGVGSASEAELGYYDADKKEYQKMIFKEPMEVLSVTGNIGILDTQVVVHLHGSLGLSNYQMIGGHIHKLVVNRTVEIMIDTMGGEMKRAYDEETGLNLLTP